MEHAGRTRRRQLLYNSDLQDDEIKNILELTQRIKDRGPRDLLKGKTMGLIFQDPSLRTRVSFEVAMIQLGGSCIQLRTEGDLYALEASAETVMDGSAPEHVKDSARTLSGYLDAIGIRASRKGNDWASDREDVLLNGYAEHATVPVINLQSHMAHPCQALGDIFTMQSKVRSLAGRSLSLTWTQNPASPGLGIPHSLVLLAARMGMNIKLAHPQGFGLDEEVMQEAQEHASRMGGKLEVIHDIEEGTQGADFVYARSWHSLRCYDDPDREALMKRSLDHWIVTQELISASSSAWVMQPLPVRRNLSVTDEVLDGDRSLIYEQAKNRLHVQKALLLHLL